METESIKAATSGDDIGPDGKPIDKQSEEIKEIMKRYSDIIGLCEICMDLHTILYLRPFQ